MKKVNYKKLILPNIPYVFIGLFATKLGQAARLSPGADFSAKALNIMDGISMAYRNFLSSFLWAVFFSGKPVNYPVAGSDVSALLWH